MHVRLSHCVSLLTSPRRFSAIVGLVAGAAVGLHGDRVRPAPFASAHNARADVASATPSSSSPRSLDSLDAATRQSIFDAMRVARETSDRQGVDFTNPEQHLLATIGSAGTTIVGRDGARVRFTRASLGRRQIRAGVAAATPDEASIPLAAASVEGAGTSRATIVRSASGIAVTEWWTNTTAGIEQGFTIETRPPGEGVLALDQTVDTALTARVSDDGASVMLTEKDQVRLQFEHLRAWDRDGRDLPARLEVRGNTLAMVVDDAGATYPVTIDPTWTQQAYLKASNTGAGDLFGWAVAVSGNTVVVGANGEASAATGVNGDQANNSASSAGAVYVFVRTGTTWTQEAYLKASNTAASDNFGSAVAVDGDTIVVGAIGEDSNAPGVNGNQANNNATDSGAAYVFVRTAGTWTQQAYLKASNTEFRDYFGYSVAVSGDTVVVGAYEEDSIAPGVNGNQANNSATDAGAAYVFVRTGTTWTQQAYLKASNTGSGDVFGNAVAVSGDTVVVAAVSEDSAATGVDGDQANNSASFSGAAYVFTRTGTTWTQQAYLKASNSGISDGFGTAVAVSGDTVVVGARGEDSNATGVNGNQADNSLSSAGAAYVFVRTGTTWTQQAYLKASNPGSDDFGWAVAVSGDTLVVGAEEDSNATGVDGNQADNSASNAGAAYVFVRTGTTWTQQAYLKASNTGSGDQFSFAVAVSGNTVVVGARGEASAATGVNGNQADNGALAAGAAYVFRLVGPAGVDLNGDGNGDAFVYKSTTGFWGRQLSQPGGGFVGSGGGWAPGWSVQPAHFNSDALTDFFVFSTTTGQWFKMLTDGSGFTAQSTGDWWPGWQRHVMDLDGDGMSDVFLYDPVTGQWFKCISTPTGFIYSAGGWSPGWELSPLRLNSDTREDLFLINRTTGQWVWALSEVGGGFTYPVWGAWSPDWKIYPGDFNGDGRSDLLLHNPTTAQYYVATNTGAGFSYEFGAWSLGWTPYVVDLDGNDVADLFLYNTSGMWFELLSDGFGHFTGVGSGFWSPDWQVHPTDFNADGRTDLLLYSPSTGQYYQAWNLFLGSFAYFSGGWDTGLTILVGKPVR